MSNQTVYIPVPVSDLPKKEGWYDLIDPNGSPAADSFYFLDGDFYDTEEEARNDENHEPIDVEGLCWLKSIQVSEESPVQKIIDRFEKLGDMSNHPAFYGASEEAKKQLDADLARSAYIKELEDKLSKLEKEKDQLKGELLTYQNR